MPMGADRISVVGCPGSGTSWWLTASIKYSLMAPWPAKFPNRYPTYRNCPDFSVAIQTGDVGAIAGFLVGPVEKGEPGTSTRPTKNPAMAPTSPVCIATEKSGQ